MIKNSNIISDIRLDPFNLNGLSQCSIKDGNVIIPDIITFYNNKYENISFDPRIRFLLDKINHSIKGYSILEIDGSPHKIKITGLKELINTTDSEYNFIITETSIHITWSLYNVDIYIHIELDIIYVDGYLFYCRLEILDEDNNKLSKIYLNESIYILYGKDSTLKYFSRIYNDNEHNTCTFDNITITNGNVFDNIINRFSDTEKNIRNNLNISKNISRLYYYPFILSKNNILIVKNKEKNKVSEMADVRYIQIYCKHAQKEYSMNCDNDINKLIESDNEIADYNKKSIRNIIFDSYDIIDYNIKKPDCSETHSEFKIGNFTGKVSEHKTINHPFCFTNKKVLIKNNNIDFLSMEYSCFAKSEQCIFSRISISIFSTKDNATIMEIYIEKKDDIENDEPLMYEIIVDNISKYFQELIGNPFMNLSNQTIIDKELICNLYQFNKNVYKRPMLTILDIESKVDDLTGSPKSNILSIHRENNMTIKYEQSDESNPKMYTYGTPQNKYTQIQKTVTDENNNIVSIQNITIDTESGNIVNESTIDYSKISLYIRDKYTNNNGSIGYKACIGPNSEYCVVKLYIYPDSYIATDQSAKKFRTNRCRIIDIARVEKSKITEDFRYKLCEKCGLKTADQIALPCKHYYCNDCCIICVGDKCVKCKELIIINGNIVFHHVSNIKICDITTTYSFITNHIQKYELDTDVVISDYNTDLEKKCANGVHYHDDINEVYQWFEFLDIPEEIKMQKYNEINIHDIQPNIPVNYVSQVADTSYSDQMKLHNKLRQQNIFKTDSLNKTSDLIIDEIKNRIDDTHRTGVRHRHK